MADVIEARVKQKKDTLANWEANPMIILDGEQAFVVSDSGQPINFKIGDGTKRFSELPWWISYDQGQYVQVSGLALPSPTVELGYTFVGPGTYTHAGQPDIVAPEGRFSQLVWDGTSWSLIDMGELPAIPIVNSLLSNSDSEALAANQGRILNEKKAENSDIGIKTIGIGELDLLSEYRGSDRNDTSSNSIWRAGYINDVGGTSGGTNSGWVSNRNPIPLKKGSYRTSIYIQGNACVALVDENGSVLQVYKDKGALSSTPEWVFEAAQDCYFLFSYAKSLDAEANYKKLEDRILTNETPIREVTSDVFIKTVDLPNHIDESLINNYDIVVTPAGQEFIGELIGSDFNDSSLWRNGFLTETGDVNLAANFKHTVKFYRMPKGKYKYRLFFSSNARAIMYDINTREIIRTFSYGGADDHTVEFESDKDFLFRFSHRQVAGVSDDRINNIYVKNTDILRPKIITSENINEFASNNSYRQIIKDSHKPRVKRRIACFISDDGYSSEYSWFLPKLEEHGVRGTIAIRTDKLDYEPFLTTDQVIELHERGHEIASHTKTHPRMNEITPEQLHEELGGSKTWIESTLNTDCPTFISPFGIRNDSIDRVIAAYYRWNIISGLGHINNLPLDSYFLNRISMDWPTEGNPGPNTRFEDYVKPLIDDAAIDNNLLLFAFHSARGEYNTRRAEVDELIVYLQSIGYEIMTVKNAMKYYANPVEIGVKRADGAYYKLGIDGSEENNSYFL